MCEQVRLNQLMRHQERLLRESEATVERRETIVLRREAIVYGSTRGATRGATRGELSHVNKGLQSKIHDTHKVERVGPDLKCTHSTYAPSSSSSHLHCAHLHHLAHVHVVFSTRWSVSRRSGRSRRARRPRAADWLS